MDTGPYDLRLKLTGLKMPCGEEYFLSISSSTVAVFNPESKACAKRNGLRVEPGDLKAFAPLLNPSQKGIDRISDKLDQLQAKYADTTANESVASLDSNITGDAGSPALTITNQTSIISPPTLFTPMSLMKICFHYQDSPSDQISPIPSESLRFLPP